MPVGRDQVGHQLIAGALVLAHHDDGLRDGGQRGERRLDLAELDAQTAQLHLEVGAAQVFQFPGRGPHHQVAGAVHALAVAERIGHEAIRGQVGPRHIAGGQLIARQIELTRGTHRHRPQPRIQHVHLGIEDRGADRHGGQIGIGHLVVGDVDGGLGGAVQVVQARAGQRAQLLCGRRGQALTGGEDIAQRGASGDAVLGHEHGQHGRHEVQRGDLLGLNEADQVGGIAVAVRLGDHQSRTDLQRPEELPHRHVEGGGRLLQHDIVGGQRVLGVHPHQAVDDGGVRDRDALGAAGRTRGEDDVRGVLRAQRRATLGIGDRSVGEGRQLQLVDTNLACGNLFQIIAGSQHADRLCGLEDVLGALGRVIRVQRHVRATGHGDGVHADHQIERAAHTERHKGFRPHARGDEPARQLPDATGELGVGQTRPLERDRHGIGGQRDLVLKQRDQRGGSAFGDLGQRRVQIEGGVVPGVQHLVALDVVEQLHIPDPHGRVGDHGAEHAHEPLREGVGERAVEKVGGVDEFGGHAAVVVGDLAQRQLQIEFGRLLVHAQLGHAQARQFQGGAAQVLEGEHDLEQRVPRLRARRVEHLDEALERHVRVGEGLQVALTHLLQQIGEGVAGVHLRTQYQGVDEHADEIVERLLATARDRDADGDVVGAAQARQQRGESTVHHHEQRGAVLLRHTVQAGDELARHLEAVRARTVGGDGRTRLAGQPQLVRQAVEGGTPVVELLGDQRARILFGAQGFPLPQRVIGVLHRQFRPARGLAVAARHIGGHEIAHQRVHRESVGGDVVRHQYEHVIVGGDLEGPQPHRQLGGDIEAATGEFVDRTE
ncbi:hypothetical protein Ntsu_70250 [Nocardia sp. IFM 10818]